MVRPSRALLGSALGAAISLAAGHAASQGLDAFLASGGDTLVARHASATAWQPEATPMNALHLPVAGWNAMIHGAVSGIYLREETLKGGSFLGSTNWAMASAARRIGGGSLRLTTMVSLETLTAGECGYPRLLANGPGCPAHFIGEFQHPHPPVMELAATYLRSIGPFSGEFYGAVVGEPAFGPVPFFHRYSAGGDPVSPISHHETNPAHAASGVLTAGVGGRRWKVEASAFSAEIADHERLLPRAPALGSYSARLSVNPTRYWSLQLSSARIEAGAGHHQGSEPALIRATTASGTHHREIQGATLAITGVWSRFDDGTLPRQSFLLESGLDLGERHAVFGRAELADRHLNRVTLIDHPDGSHDHLVDVESHRVAQLSAGYRVGIRLGAMMVSLGARGSFSVIPEALRPAYNAKRPVGVATFLSLTPMPAAQHHHEARVAPPTATRTSAASRALSAPARPEAPPEPPPG